MPVNILPMCLASIFCNLNVIYRTQGYLTISITQPLNQGSQTQVSLGPLLVLSSCRRATTRFKYYKSFILIINIIIQKYKLQFIYILRWLVFNSWGNIFSLSLNNLLKPCTELTKEIPLYSLAHSWQHFCSYVACCGSLRSRWSGLQRFVAHCPHCCFDFLKSQ